MRTQLKRLWHGVDAVRRFAANLLFLAFLLFCVVLWTLSERETTPVVAQGSVLVVRFDGNVVETSPEPARSLSGLRRLMAADPADTRLLEVTEALAAAAKDPRIAGVLLDLDGMRGVGLASVRTIGEAVDAYRKTTGRPVLAWANAYTQGAYGVAAHADEVWTHPMGTVELKGLSGRSLYWGEFLRHWSIGVDVYKAGAFKSAPEVFLRDSASEENLVAQRAYLDPAWKAFASGIERARSVPEGTVSGWIDAVLCGDARTLKDPLGTLKRMGLLTGTSDRSAFEAHAAERFGLTAAALREVDYRDYLYASADTDYAGECVALITAEGEISNEPALGGIVADELTARLQEAADTEGVRAVVLRINSPGGDALASEFIRERIAGIRAEGTPVVVSMGDAAASGGYWLSTAADRIVADPQTLTGSIGVFAVVPNVEELLARNRIGADGWRTAPTADYGTPLSRPDEAEARLYRASVERIYRRFTELVAEARNLSPEALESAAGGRIWIGTEAKRLGLVDELGSLDEAVRIAGTLGGLGEEPAVLVFDPMPQGWDGWLMSLASGFGVRMGTVETLRALALPLSSIEAALRPGSPMAYCADAALRL